jgi:hypothetical protein
MRGELHWACTTRERKEKCIRILVENPEERPAWKDLDVGRSIHSNIKVMYLK